MSPAPLRPPVVPFAVRPRRDLRPDLWPLHRPPPAHVDDPGPRTLVRLDGETATLARAKHRLVARDPDPWTALAPDLEPGRLHEAGLALARRVAEEYPPLLHLDAPEVLRAPGLGVSVGPDARVGRVPPQLDAPVTGDADAVAARLEALPPHGRAAELVALAVAEDLVLVDRDARAVWVHVCAPSDWDPGAAGGAPLATLHGPVPAADRLRAASAALGRAIVATGPHVRWNWGLTPDAVLARHPGLPATPPEPGPPVAALTFRAERQTTLPLAHLDLGVFTIRVHRAPLVDMVADGSRRERLAAAIRALPEELAAYKGIAGRREELLAWLVDPSASGRASRVSAARPGWRNES